MIARYTILLPFDFTIPHDAGLSPIALEIGGYYVRVLPPVLAILDMRDLEPTSPVPYRTIVDRLIPGGQPDPTDLIRMDEAQTIRANLLQLEFIKEDFDRREPPEEMREPREHMAYGDPSPAFAFEVANGILGRIRSLSRAAPGKSLDPLFTYFRLDYFHDDGREVESREGFFRRRHGGPVGFQVLGVTRETWEKGVRGIGQQPLWDALLLDAQLLLPDAGPAIVLAFSALETFIIWCLSQLASQLHVSPELWKWINERKDIDTRPTIEERYGNLLRILGGRPLTENQALWQAFLDLRNARNKFVHEGQASVGGEKVTPEIAIRLVSQAADIIDWVEGILPPNLRRPKLERPPQYRFVKNVL